GADGVIVAGDHVVDTFRAAVGIDDADNRNAQLVGFGDGNALVLDVDHEDGIGQAAHVLDTAQAAIQFFQITGAHQRFFLGQLGESAVFGLDFQIAQTLDRLTNGLVVGQHAAEPTVINIGHAGAGGFFSNDLAGSALGA